MNLKEITKAKGFVKGFIIEIFLAFVLLSFVLFSGVVSASITNLKLISPENNNWTNNNDVKFIFNVISSSSNYSYCNLTINGEVKATNDSVENNTNTTFEINLNEGKYNWNITCEEISSVTPDNKTSETRTLYVDTTSPNVTLSSPVNNSNFSFRKKVDFKFNVTDNLASSLSCTLYLNNNAKKTDNVSNGSIAIWTLDDLSAGNYSWQVKCNDPAENQFSTDIMLFNIKSYCEKGKIGDLVFSIEEPDSGDNFYAGYNVSVEVKVKNKYDDDLDIVIEVELYDLTDDEEVETIEYETTIKEGATKTYKLNLQIPSTINPDHDYVINAKVYEDGNEEEQCNEDSVAIVLEKKSHKVVISSFSLEPNPAQCTDFVKAIFEIENAGLHDEDIKIKLKNSELGIDLSKEISLDEGDSYESDEDNYFRFFIPKNASEGNYSLILTVIYNDGENSVTSNEILEIKGNCFSPVYDVSISTEQVGEAFNGQQFAIKVLIRNTGNVVTTYKVDVSDYESWASLARIEGSPIEIKNGSYAYAYVYLIPFENASGTNLVKIKVNFDNITKEETLTINVRKASKEASWFDQLGFEIKHNWQWLLVDILLVVIVIVLLVLLLKSRIKKIKTMEDREREIRVRRINEKEFRRKR